MTVTDAGVISSLMKANSIKPAAQRQRRHKAPPVDPASENEINPGLLEESLAKTVWERMLANDDALRLADLLQAAMVKARAKS